MPASALFSSLIAGSGQRLHLKHKWELDYDTMVREDTAVTDHETYLRHNVGQISLFEVVGSPGTEIIVANTHLFWNPQVLYGLTAPSYHYLTRF